MNTNWKQTVAQAIVCAPVQTPISTDSTLAVALQAALPALPARDADFARSLLAGFTRYGSFTDRQRPHAERLVSAPAESPDKALGAALKAALPYLQGRDTSFATSLLSGFEQYGRFTDRQRPYVERLVQSVAAPAPAPAPVPAPAITLPVICGLVNLNRFARFTVGKLTLSLKNDGSLIWVKWGGSIAGRIDSATCVYTQSRKYLRDAALAEALAMLHKIEADPLNTARDEGVLTGRCACCSRPLTDPVSIDFGIGPICREKFSA